jgi:hypothetical protein
MPSEHQKKRAAKKKEVAKVIFEMFYIIVLAIMPVMI